MKTPLLAMALLILLVALSSCSQTEPVKTDDSKEIQTPEQPVIQESETVPTTSLERCIDKCSGDTPCLNRCTQDNIVFRATQLKDPSICEELINENLITNCKESIQIKESIESGRLADCDKIEGDNAKAVCKDGYWMNEAIQKSDRSLCDNIKKANTKQACIDSIR